MKKSVFAILTIFCLSSGSVFAAIGINGANCRVLDADGFETVLAGAVINQESTPSGNSVTCNGTLPEGAAKSDRGASVWTHDDSDALCNTGVGLTNDWHNVVTQKGKVALSCHINGSFDCEDCDAPDDGGGNIDCNDPVNSDHIDCAPPEP